jgi:hypothetical protein
MLRNFLVLAGVSMLLVAGCATRPASPVAASNIEPFVIERDLAGKTVGRGAFKSINGVDRPFTAYLDGTWDGQVLTLVEDFEFEDGEKDRKTWRLTKLENGEFSGTREDVIDTARGFYDGDTFRLEYFIRLPAKDGSKGTKVKFRDVLVKRDDGVILNTATVGFWGFRVGTVELEISRQ